MYFLMTDFELQRQSWLHATKTNGLKRPKHSLCGPVRQSLPPRLNQMVTFFLGKHKTHQSLVEHPTFKQALKMKFSWLEWIGMKEYTAFEIGISRKCDAFCPVWVTIPGVTETDRSTPYSAGRFGTKLVPNFQTQPLITLRIKPHCTTEVKYASHRPRTCVCTHICVCRCIWGVLLFQLRMTQGQA